MPEADVNGVKLHYESAGNGPAIVLVTPPLLTRAIFRFQAEHLSDAFRIVTFDVRGHGRSGRSPEPVSLPLLADDVLHLMDALGIRRAFVGGYFTGAAVALEALIRSPGRFYGGILLSGMSEFSDWYNIARLKAAQMLAGVLRGRLLAWAVYRGNADGKESFARLYRDALLGSPDHWRQYYRSSETYRCTARLAGIRQPVLLVYGGKDRPFDRYARLLQRELANPSMATVEGASHQLPMKAAAAVNRLIRDFAEDVLKRQPPDEDGNVPQPAGPQNMSAPPAQLVIE